MDSAVDGLLVASDYVGVSMDSARDVLVVAADSVVDSMDSAGNGPFVASQNNTSAASTADAQVIEMSTANISLKKVRLVMGLRIEVLDFIIILLGLWFLNKNRVYKDEDEDESVSYTFLNLVNVAQKFSYHNLLSATNNFSEQEKLGEGSFGAVYKGFLKELNCDVAVKKMSKDSKQGIKEFASEVKILSQLRHRNIVRLMGWCCEIKELLLVYEFLPNGSLNSHLFKEESALSWETRYKIALGLASGLLYLHDGWEQYVVHRDVKASNIMLDSNFNAKLGDFGLARQAHHGEVIENSSIAGTIGYVAPEYAALGRASKGSDVFSFGSVALEIACGRKVIDRNAIEDQFNLREWVWDLYGKGQLLDAVDPRLNGEFDRKEVECLMTVGIWCSHPDANLRPTIEKAIHVLKFVAPPPDLPSEFPMTTIFAPLSSSSATTNPVVTCNSSVHIIDNFSKQRKSAKGDLLAIFKRFSFGRRRRTSERVEIAKTNLDPLELPSNNCRIFSNAEIRRATNNFQMVIGRGGFGTVYKGYIDGGSTTVAIKSCVESSVQGKDQFLTEISILSRIEHHNIVSLIGYHSGKHEMIVVYEYMAQGTLRDHLYKTQKLPLLWFQRLKVCIGAARGLHYLHTGTNNTIIHRDIKSTNILLDDKFEARISDFGISRVGPTADSETYVSTAIRGTPGYLDPEYLRSNQLTEKSDVYSFGVVLFEVLCGRPAIQMKEENEEVRHVAAWALHCHKMGTLDQIIDPYLKGKIAPESFKTFTDLAIKCVADKRSERPPMKNVLYNLQLAIRQHIAYELQLNIAAEEPKTLISESELSEINFTSVTAKSFS